MWEQVSLRRDGEGLRAARGDGCGFWPESGAGGPRDGEYALCGTGDHRVRSRANWRAGADTTESDFPDSDPGLAGRHTLAREPRLPLPSSIGRGRQAMSMREVPEAFTWHRGMTRLRR